jgi:hypothetical protein
LGYFFLNTIAAATEYGIKHTKSNQLGLELHGTHHSHADDVDLLHKTVIP